MEVAAPAVEAAAGRQLVEAVQGRRRRCDSARALPGHGEEGGDRAAVRAEEKGAAIFVVIDADADGRVGWGRKGHRQVEAAEVSSPGHVLLVAGQAARAAHRNLQRRGLTILNGFFSVGRRRIYLFLFIFLLNFFISSFLLNSGILRIDER